MFSTDVTIRVLGYSIGEGVNDDRPIVRIDENIVEVTYPTEEDGLGGESLFGGADFSDASVEDEDREGPFDASDYIRSV